MSHDIDFDELLHRYKSYPFEYLHYFALQSGQVPYQVVDVEENHLTGQHLFQVIRAGINPMVNLGAPFKILVNHEDGRTGDRAG